MLCFQNYIKAETNNSMKGFPSAKTFLTVMLVQYNYYPPQLRPRFDLSHSLVILKMLLR